MKKEMGKMLRDVANRHKNKLRELAVKNTIRNEDGLTVIEKGDPWREDSASRDIRQLSRSGTGGVLA